MPLTRAATAVPGESSSESGQFYRDLEWKYTHARWTCGARIALRSRQVASSHARFGRHRYQIKGTVG